MANTTAGVFLLVKQELLFKKSSALLSKYFILFKSNVIYKKFRQRTLGGLFCVLIASTGLAALMGPLVRLGSYPVIDYYIWSK